MSHLSRNESSSSKLALIKVEKDELKATLLELEGEKQSFEERYDLFAGEKESLEDKVAALDGSVEHFSQRIEFLVEEKKVLESRANCVNKWLEEDIAREKFGDEDLGWLLQKGIFRVVDKFVESAEFSLGLSG